MKVKAPSLLKKVIAAFSNKTNDLRVRLMIFFLLHKNIDKSSLTTSLQALVSHHPHHKKKNDDAINDDEELELVENQQIDEDDNKEIPSNHHSMLLNYNKAATSMVVSDTHDKMVVEDIPRTYTMNQSSGQQRNVGMTHALFRESEVEIEKERQPEEAVEEVEEEEEEMGDEDIDQAADMFIQRFKKQMLLQKQRSLERQQYNNGNYLLSNA